VNRDSFSEEGARERARLLLDHDTYREFLGPFARLESPHLALQDIVPQSDDGVVVARGTIERRQALVLSIEGRFQGGSIGEVNGTKIAGALELALRSAREGNPIIPVLVLDTAGIRLQEANLGLLSVRDIHTAIVSLREFVPVIALIAGRVGCFGGMAIAATLCTVVIGTEIGRLGLNGPEVIEQEAGLAEFDAQDRKLIWSTMGCRRRLEAGQIDFLVEDSVAAIRATITDHCGRGNTATPRSVRRLQRWGEGSSSAVPSTAKVPLDQGSRGLVWLKALSEFEDFEFVLPSVQSCDLRWQGEAIRLISVTPNPASRFPRSRGGEVSVEEAFEIERLLREVVKADARGNKRAILAIVDSPGQAFGREEELLGIHEALGAAVDAYAMARKMGHPVISLLVGKAISGAFLAHGLQSDVVLALDADGVEVHVMSASSVGRITRRGAFEIEAIARIVPSTSRDIRSFATLGGIDELIPCRDPDSPGSRSIELVKTKLIESITSVRGRSANRALQSDPVLKRPREGMSSAVRVALEKSWN
jgi:malonate decarboxylase beta subunit